MLSRGSNATATKTRAHRHSKAIIRDIIWSQPPCYGDDAASLRGRCEAEKRFAFIGRFFGLVTLGAGERLKTEKWGLNHEKP